MIRMSCDRIGWSYKGVGKESGQGDGTEYDDVNNLLSETFSIQLI